MNKVPHNAAVDIPETYVERLQPYGVDDDAGFLEFGYT